MLRIHFTAEDLARTTLAADPDPLWEVLLSLHMLQVEDGPVPYGAWRQRMRRKLPRESVGPLTALAPPVTTELATACRITLATASHQTAVLRDAGLIESRRHGKSVQHRATQLGHALLEGSAPV